MTWWDEGRIEATVTRQFVSSHLLAEELAQLDQPLGFGDGLTDGTYWEWINEKAKRIFLILVDLGIPDQIFGLIDDSWDDDDLPIAYDQIDRLALTATRDDKIDKKFYNRQFHYLLRFMPEGDYTVYDDAEVVPIEVVDKKPGLNHPQAVDRVQLPNRRGEILSRRRIPVGVGNGLFPEEEFLFEVDSTKNIQNPHIVSYWGSYFHQGYGYVLFSPASAYNLKSFLSTTPTSIKSMDKQPRRSLVINWVHCLVDTLCYLHGRGASHGNIKPSTILFSAQNQILFTDITRLSAESLINASEKAAFDKESYDYAAPEQWYRPSAGRRKDTLTRPTSPDTQPYSINRGHADNSNSQNPLLDPQAADIFSLGCIILELVGFLLKRQTRSFATHRAAKHKTPGRGGAVLDSSFHKNLGQVESWMVGLAKDARKKDEAIFRGIAPMLQVVAKMMSVNPQDRPSAMEVEKRMYQILTEECRIQEPHCVHQYGGWDFGLGNLRLSKGSESMTIATKRSSGSSRSLEHRRSDSNGHHEADLTGNPNYQVIRGIRPNKVKTWEAPVYAETSFG